MAGFKLLHTWASVMLMGIGVLAFTMALLIALQVPFCRNIYIHNLLSLRLHMRDLFQSHVTVKG